MKLSKTIRNGDLVAKREDKLIKNSRKSIGFFLEKETVTFLDIEADKIIIQTLPKRVMIKGTLTRLIRRTLKSDV